MVVGAMVVPPRLVGGAPAGSRDDPDGRRSNGNAPRLLCTGGPGAELCGTVPGGG